MKENKKGKNLTDAICRSLPLLDKRYMKRGDYPGLEFWVQPGGTKSWAYQYSIKGTKYPIRKNLGTYPVVGVVEATNRVKKLSKDIFEGADPKQYVSVAATLNMKKFDSSELEQYTLTRSEYANKIGKTTNAVRMMQRHGKLSGEYRFDGNKFLFKSPERPGDYMVNDHARNIKLTTPKKKINRGNHFKASYPNNAFKLHNELKMLNKIKSNIPDNVLNEINPELIKLAQERVIKKQDDLIKKSFVQPRNYGNSYPINIEKMRNTFKSSDTSYRPVRNYYDPISSIDDGSVEVEVSRSSQSEPQFKSKVAESIWRLKNKK
tara:strand:+ start:242 stop:1201 length:960 start_codon:yes stop_codon:yes gene_type:complete